MNDTIAAISTPFGEGAIAVVRLCGPRALALADDVFRGKTKASELPPRVQTFGRFVTHGEEIDDVLVTVFRTPASYTGEDVVEFSCHGGILVTRRVLQALLNGGARLAHPGEFTQRAFLNGRMDLTQAEAVMDLIRAQTDLALRAAHEQLEGTLGRRVAEIRDQLLGVLAHVEAFIDFPDEDITPETGAELQRSLAEVEAQTAALLRTAGQGRVLREGVRTVIAGAPNVGKSSLLNVLLGYERAIVSETPGTTRDTIEEVIALRGIPLRLVDTAGLRESADAIEREGIRRTHQHIERADLVLRVFDGSQPPLDQASGLALESFAESSGRTGTPATIAVVNKADLGEHAGWREVAAVRVSCAANTGFDALADAIFGRVMGDGLSFGDHAVAINARHQSCLKDAQRFGAAAAQALSDGLSAEFVAVDLRAALDSLGEIVGGTGIEDLLDRIFSAFCIGK